MIAIDRASNAPLSEQIVRQLAAQIQDGGLPAGSRLPSIRKLAAQLQVSAATVVAAYDRLGARGLIASRAASGYFVLARKPAPAPPPPLADENRNDAIGALRRMCQPRPGRIHAGSGYFPAEWLEDTLSSRLLARVARQGARAWVTPGVLEGNLPLRRQLALKLEQQGMEVAAEQILTTFGVTHAIDLILRTLLVAGDAVAVEEPSYFGQAAQLRAAGIRLVPIPRRADGPDLEALEAACAHFRPKLFFTQTLMHNPTGGATSVAVASRLVQLAERHELLLVEDDIFGDLHPDPHPVRLAQIDGFRRTIYVNSFSKTLSPAVRVGYLVAPAKLREALGEAKLLSVMSTSDFDEHLVHEVLAGGGYRKHLERLRLRLARQWPGVRQGLSSAGLKVAEPPHAPMFAWAALPAGVDEGRLVREAEEHGYTLAPGRIFHIGAEPQPYLRFSTAMANDPRLFDYLRRALATLGKNGAAGGLKPAQGSAANCAATSIAP